MKNSTRINRALAAKKKFNLIVDRVCANTPPCRSKRASRVLGLVLVLLTLGVGQAWGTEYTYKAFTTSFVKGTTNGASGIGTSFSTSSSLSTISSSNEIFTSTPTSVSNCFYNTSGAGIRISKNGGGGSVKFTLTDALKDSTIYAIVVYASKVSGNTAAKLDITPTGGYTTTTNISNGGLTAYNTSTPATTSLTTYKLDTIKVGGKKINTLQFASANKGYTMLHAITIVTQTEKAATPSCSSEITITKGSNPANGTFTIDNSGTVCIDEGNASTTVTATPSSHYHLATVTSSGGGTIGSISNNTCTVSSISANTTINVTFAADPTYTVTWVAGSNPSFSTQTNYAGTALTDPGEPSPASYCPGGKVFVGWTATPIVGEGAEPADLFTSVSGMSIPVGGTTYYAVFATQGGSGSVTKSDELTYTSFFAACTPSGSNTSGSYTNFSDKSGSKSDAVYAGNLNKHGNGSSNCHDYIQMRTSSNSGIITTTSGGKAKKVTVEWNSGTANAKVVNIYGKNTAYSAISDLFSDATDGDLLGTITKGTSTELTITGDYEYIGIRSSDGAIYFDAISIDWQAGGGYTYTDFATTCCIPLGTINGSVSVTNQTVSWSAVEDASGYKVKVGEGSWSDIGNNTSHTFNLDCGGDIYNVYVKAYNTNNAGHCTGDGPESSAIQVTSAACTEPALAADPTSLTGLNYIVNAGPSVAQSFSISGTNLEDGSLTITAPTNYEVSKTSATAGFANSVSVNANGTLSATDIWVRLKADKAVGNYNSETVSISGCGLASAVNVTISGSVLKPTITATPTSITDWSTQTGSAPNPATKTITVTGSNLKADISASLTAGSDYFTITPSSLAQSEGSVNNGSVVIGVKAATYAAAGTYEGTLRLSTTDGDNEDVAISLTVADDPREKFTLLTSSNVGEIGDGTRLVIVESSRDYAMNRSQDGTNGHGEISSTNQFSFQLENAIITLEVINSVEILTLEETSTGVYALKTESTSKYLEWNGGNNNKFSEVNSYNADNAKWTIEVDENGYALITANSGSGRLIGYNSTATTSTFRAYSSNSSHEIYAYFKASTTPKVNISGTLETFTYMRDSGPSVAQSFKVWGKNLSANLVVTAPTNYEVCETVDGDYEASVEFTPSDGSVAQTDVYIRLKSDLAVNSYNGDITVGSTGATNATKAVEGSVTTPVYNVTLHTNGGTINADNITSYTEGAGATLPTDVTKDGYSFGGWFANSDLETGGVQTTIATNATGAKEYWAKWNELPGYDITWLVDGEEYTGGEPTTRVTEGGSISSLPSTPTSLDITSKTFVGWTTAAVTEKQANAPSPLYTTAGEIPGNITAEKTFHAVFAQETYSGTFTKITDASTLAAGNRLLIFASNYAAGTLGSNNYLSRESVTTNNNEVTDKGNASVFTLGGTSGSWTLTSAEGTLGCTGTSNNSLSMSDGTTTWVITINSGNATIKPTDLTTYIKYNSSGNRFSSYASGQTTPQLYREGTTRTNYTTKFVKPVAVTGVTLNKNVTTLAIGATETLTATVAPDNATNKNISWTTSAEGVATVEDGVITAVAAGEATITVTTEDGSKTDACVVTVLPTVEKPTFTVAGGTYNADQTVEIECATEGATIYYTTNGEDPTAIPANLYNAAISVTSDNTVIKAIAVKTGSLDSEIASATYHLQCATPTFGKDAGEYLEGLDDITIACTGTAGATIHYTIDGNDPDANSDEYTSALTISSTTTVKAIATKENYLPSAIASATYTIIPAYTVTWMNRGVELTTTPVAQNGTISAFPTTDKDGCGAYTHFYGWAEGEFDTPTASPTSSSTIKVYRDASELPAVTSDVTYHAVWANAEPGWVKASSVEAGDKVIIVNETNSKEMSDCSTSSTGVGTATAYSTSVAGTYPLTIVNSSTEGYVKFKTSANNYLRADNGNYLYQTSAAEDAYQLWTIEFINGDAIINNKGYNSRYINYNNQSSGRFAAYAKNDNNPYGTQMKVQLYKKSDVLCVTDCDPNIVTITYDGNGAMTECESAFVTKGGTGTYTVCTTEPAKDYYEFAGWSMDGIHPVGATIAEADINGDITLTALWTPVEYTITYNLNGGENAVANPATYTVESADIVLAAPTKGNSRFEGWYKGSALVTTIATGSPENIVLDAEWTDRHEIVFDVNGETTTIYRASDENIEDAVGIGSKPANPAAPGMCNGNKDFVGWVETPFDGNTDTKPASLTDATGTVNSDKHFYAVWADADTHPGIATIFEDDMNVDLGTSDNVSDYGKWDFNDKVYGAGTGEDGIRLSSSNVNGSMDLDLSDETLPTSFTISFELLKYSNDAGSIALSKFNSGSTATFSNPSSFTATTTWTTCTCTVTNTNQDLEGISFKATNRVYVKNVKVTYSGMVTDYDQYATGCHLVVDEAEPLNVTENASLTSLTVKTDGEVSVATGKTLTVKDVTIQSTSGAFEVDGTSGQLSGSGTLTVTGDLYLEIKLRDGDMDAEASRKWYCISAPFDVDINNGFYWGDGTHMGHNVDFQIFEWDGDRRATGASGWRRTSGTMKKDTAYFIGFDDARSNQNTIKLKATDNTISNRAKIVAPAHSGSAEAATYGNWNGLANPNFHHIALNKDVQAFDYNKQGYSPYETGEYNFVVGTPFFIQYAGDIAIEAADNAYYRAPRRGGENYSYSVRIGSADASRADNRIVVRASETASAEFDNERDMITMNGTSSSYGALLWTENYGGKRLAIEEAPLVNGTASYVLTLSAPANGTYSISVAAAQENADLYLTYEGAIIWNLSMGAYTMDLNKGITNGYGLLLQAKAPNSATGVDEVTGDGLQVTGAQKVIIDEHVYILRGGQMYDVNGKMVK